MSDFALNPSDYNALILAQKKKSTETPENSEKKTIEKAEKISEGKVSLGNFTKDEAQKIAAYFSQKESNASQPVSLWQDDGLISEQDFSLTSEQKKVIDKNNDGKISSAEFAKALTSGKITFGLNTSEKLFKTEAEKNEAQKYLDRLGNFAFDPVRTVEDRFLNLKPIRQDAYNGEYSFPQIDPDVGDIDLVDFNKKRDLPVLDTDQSGDVNGSEFYTALENGDLKVFDEFKNVQNYEDLREAISASLARDPEVIAELGENPTQEELDAYIEENLETILQEFGGNFPYNGYVSMSGDVNAWDTLAKGFGVCSDQHAVITAMRKAYGQEAYLVWTSGLDYSHVFTIYKDKDNTWNIQNYDTIVDTDAKTLTELYDKYMPQHRTMKVYDVSEDGSVKTLSAEHYTATGLKERRFRQESGVSGYNPWFSEDGVTAGNNEISVAKNGFFLGVNPSDGSLSSALYKKSMVNGKERIQGGAIEGQYYTNPGGYEYRHLDAKYEVEKKYSQTNRYGREHFSVQAGVEQNEKELYWKDYSGSDDAADTEEKEAAVRLGISYQKNDAKLFGNGSVKFELGQQTKIGTNLTVDPLDPFETHAPKYIGRVHSDSNLETKAVTGVFLQPTKDFTARAGLATGVDLLNIDGFKNAGQQFDNIFEADIYADLSYSKGPVAINALGLVPIDNLDSSIGSQYKFALGAAVAPTKHFVIGSTYINEKVFNDHIDYLSVGAELKPSPNVSVGGSFTTPLLGDNSNGVTGEIYGTFRFGKKKTADDSASLNKNSNPEG